MLSSMRRGPTTTSPGCRSTWSARRSSSVSFSRRAAAAEPPLGRSVVVLLLARAPAAARALVGSVEEHQRRAGEDAQIEPERAVFDVPDVQLDPLVPGQGGAPIHLRPAGQPGLDLEPAQLPGGIAVDLIAKGRARSHDAHVASENVPELRQLVEREAAQRSPGARDARVAAVDRVARAYLLGAHDHRAQLEQLEVAAVLANTPLPIQNRAAILQLDRQCRERQERARDD